MSQQDKIDAFLAQGPWAVAGASTQREKYDAMLVALDRTLTPEQRGKLHRRIAAWAADVAVLAAAAD